MYRVVSHARALVLFRSFRSTAIMEHIATVADSLGLGQGGTLAPIPLRTDPLLCI